LNARLQGKMQCIRADQSKPQLSVALDRTHLEGVILSKSVTTYSNHEMRYYNRQIARNSTAI